jgi:hypothetical protein
MTASYIGDPFTAHVEAWAAMYRLECEARALLARVRTEGRAAVQAQLDMPARCGRREALRQMMNAMQMARRKR